MRTRLFLLLSLLIAIFGLSGCKKAPDPEQNSPAPVVAEPAPAPVVAEPAPAPVVAEPAPAPVVAEPAPAPVVAEPAPAPVVAEPAPAPVVAEPAPAPVVADPAPAPVVADPAPAPVVAEPEPQDPRGFVAPPAEIPDPVAEPAPSAAVTPEAGNSPTRVRIMTANTTAGEDQSYDTGEGIRMFRAAKPDVILIQEFNYNKNTIDSFVKSTFGKEFSYHRGKGDIPNGIISRFPVLSSGAWKSNRVSDRQWDWAVLDLPGSRDLLAVSVHLFTKDNEAEMAPLLQQIQDKTKKDGNTYYVILGGDFNQTDWNVLRKNLSAGFDVGLKYRDWPQDQNGQTRTNATRHKHIDYLLCSPDLCALETPVVIGKHSYPHGHVMDSRVYAQLGELGDIPPVKAGDSDAPNMQHMPVIRDFLIP